MIIKGSDNMNTIVVVAALIKKDNKYLIAKRAYDEEENLGKWEFPGGKVEKGEDEFTAIEREMKEEFEIEIKAVKYLTSSKFDTGKKIILLKLYECEYISGEFRLNAHSEYAFVDKDKLLNYDLAPADIEFAKYIKEFC